ncbi:MAG: ATP-binding cassette domain-containing protein [Pusillimonas sp.]
MYEYILEADSLQKNFRGFCAVQDVSLRVRENTIHSLIGPNGAGKTTVFNLITKFLQPSAGRIRYKGVDITTQEPAAIARQGMIRSFQISAVFLSLSVIENVRIALINKAGQDTYKFWKPDSRLHDFDGKADELIDMVGLSDFRDYLAKDLSYGRKRALELATTLALDPEVLLLDEPMAGMGLEDIDRIGSLIRLAAKTRTVLMVEHNLSVVAKLSDTITVLQRGKVLAEGSYDEVSSNPDVRQAYMGTGGSVRAGASPDGAAASLIVHRPVTKDLLSVKGLNAWYGESHILQGVDFRIGEGEVVTLLGRNGAGKTTTLKALTGTIDLRKGSIDLDGQEIIGMNADQIARLGMAWCPEERGIFASLTVKENLVLPPIVAAGGMTEEELFDMFPNLRERLHSQGTKLSGGEQQMLALARILRTGAKLLLLDEVTEGLAPVIVEQIGRTIKRLRERGYTILLVEQNFHFAAGLADRHYIMEHGKVIDEFGASEIRGRMGALSKYLGV